MGSGMDGVSHKGSVAEVNGNRNVPCLNEGGSKRNLDLNWFDNDWNANYRFLAVRYFHYFSRLNRREFCLRAVCATLRAFSQCQQGARRGRGISSYQVLAFPMQVAEGVSEGRRERCNDRQVQSFQHVRYN